MATGCELDDFDAAAERSISPQCVAPGLRLAALPRWGERTFRNDALHVFVLSSLAFSEPQLQRLQNQPAFVSHMGPEALTIFVGALCLLIPALFVGCEWLAGRWNRRLRECLHGVLLFVGLTALLLPAFKGASAPFARWQILLSMAAAAFFTWTYFKFAGWRAVFTAACPVILLSPLLFAATTYTERSHVRAQRPLSAIDVRDPVPVVVIAFDEFNGTSLMNADREIDEARYPHFAALAKDATWFRNASSVHQNTVSALPAILSGNYPKSEQGPELAEYPRNLFTTLSATEKYDLVVFEPFTRLSPSDEHIARSGVARQVQSLFGTMSVIYLYHVLPDSWRKSLPDLKRAWFGWPETDELDTSARTGVIRHPWDTDREEQFSHFLDCITPARRPRLYFAHVALPHFPWHYLPSGKSYRMGAGTKFPEGEVIDVVGSQREMWGSDDLLTTQGYQRYLLQVGYVDHLLGQLVERLKETNIYDQCLFIVVADHGVSFRANHSRRSPNASNLADIMSVPLFVKLPGQHEGETSDRNVATIDVLPTIVDVLGLDVPFGMDGSSVIDPSREERPEKKFCGEGRVFTEAAAFESKYDTLRDRLARFGAGDDPERLFRVGPHAELIGKSVGDLAVTGRSEIQVEVECPQSFEVDASDRDVPCFLRGRVSLENSDPRLPIRLAVALNGKIRAVTRTYGLSGLRQVWSAMLPESAFGEGHNTVQLFIVSEADDRLTLEECTPAGLNSVAAD